MGQIIDLEIGAPKTGLAKEYDTLMRGRPGTPFPGSLDRPEGYGFDNYAKIFGGGSAEAGEKKEANLAQVVADMDEANVEFGLMVGVPNSEIGQIHREYPNRFKLFAWMNPRDVMRGVRELERLVKEDGANGLRVSPLYNNLPASDRLYYPLYAKCVELDIPIRVYTAMTYANDRPYEISHPRHLDDIAVDFPELKIIAGLAGWPWVGDMVALLRRHPNLYCDTAAHRPRHFGTSGSGWEPFLQFGNTLLQDKIMTGFSRYLFNTSYENLIAEYQGLPLKEAVLEKWFYQNAVNFFSD
ncbi:MAG: amidohydrolase family protein [Alphaproteobacteria bacterium]|nr:amidohydrolase family protein [Alphaproteobacteria bacterium]